DLVEIIKASPVHMILVHDEYGHFEGVVTNADILEAIVGAPFVSHEAGDDRMVQRADGSWLIPGSMSADEMAERLPIDLPKDRCRRFYSQQAAGRSGCCLGSQNARNFSAAAAAAFGLSQHGAVYEGKLSTVGTPIEGNVPGIRER
ncbi:MAG: hypothetical protein WCP68_19120, partial [Enhydrobacter sp.]